MLQRDEIIRTRMLRYITVPRVAACAVILLLLFFALLDLRAQAGEMRP